MGSANRKLEVLAKTVLMLIFGGYCIAHFFSQKAIPEVADPPVHGNGAEYEIAITGGSNVLFGISAREISNTLSTAINLSLPAERGKQLTYIDWLTQSGVHARVVVDSPIAFWNPEMARKTGASQNRLLPNKTLLKTLIELFSQEANVSPPTRHKKDARGDLIQHSCNDGVEPKVISRATLKRTAATSGYFVQRLSAIREATRAEKIMFRIPPILVSEATKQTIELPLKKVIDDFRAQGVVMLDQQILLVTDRSLFCDAPYHPNHVGRSLVTADLVHALRKAQ